MTAHHTTHSFADVVDCGELVLGWNATLASAMHGDLSESPYPAHTPDAIFLLHGQLTNSQSVLEDVAVILLTLASSLQCPT